MSGNTGTYDRFNTPQGSRRGNAASPNRRDRSQSRRPQTNGNDINRSPNARNSREVRVDDREASQRRGTTRIPTLEEITRDVGIITEQAVNMKKLLDNHEERLSKIEKLSISVKEAVGVVIHLTGDEEEIVSRLIDSVDRIRSLGKMRIKMIKASEFYKISELEYKKGDSTLFGEMPVTDSVSTRWKYYMNKVWPTDRFIILVEGGEDPNESDYRIVNYGKNYYIFNSERVINAVALKLGILQHPNHKRIIVNTIDNVIENLNES